MNNFSKETFLKFFFSLASSLFIILLSQNDVLWMNFWGFLKVPPALPPFSDFDALNIFLSYKQEGFNPYFENPNSHPVHKVYIYPSIWLIIADIFNLQKSTNFILYSFLILLTYFWILADLFYKFKHTKYIYFIIIFFFSTSNFLLIERLNVEIIIFCLVYYAIINKSLILKNSFFLISLILKIFPIFSIFLFINKKKNFFILLIFSLIYFFIMREEISLITKNIIEYALIFAYGVGSISKAFYYYSMEFGYFINDNNYQIFKYFMIILFSLYGIFIFLFNFSFDPKKKIKKKITIEEQMFLSGGGIFIGTFATSANIDYRLVFLILTLPYVLSQLKSKMTIVYFVILLVCFNSLVFQIGDPYSLFFFIKALIVYIFKIFIFSLNCYFFGKILNEFIGINFFKLKNS